MLPGESDSYEPGADLSPGEPIYIPASESGGGEDDGYIATFEYDKNSGTSAFVLFDATKLSAVPIVKVPLPVRVPVGFHGVWVPDSAMS